MHTQMLSQVAYHQHFLVTQRAHQQACRQSFKRALPHRAAHGVITAKQQDSFKRHQGRADSNRYRQTAGSVHSSRKCLAIESLPKHQLLGLGVDLSGIRAAGIALLWSDKDHNSGPCLTTDKDILADKTGQGLSNSALAKGSTQTAEVIIANGCCPRCLRLWTGRSAIADVCDGLQLYNREVQGCFCCLDLDLTKCYGKLR